MYNLQYKPSLALNRNNSMVPQGYFSRNNPFAKLTDKYSRETLEIALALIRKGGRLEGEVNNQYQEDTTLLQQPIGEVAKLENTDNIDVGGVAACTIL